jgi:fucose permease
MPHFYIYCAEYKIFRVIFTMAGKLFISGCFAVIYLLGTELYPTATRTTGLGSAVLMGRFGSILAPYVISQTVITIFYNSPY